MMDTRQRMEVTRLRDLVAELKEENRQLREALSPALCLPKSWKLRPQENELLLALYASDGVVRLGALRLAVSRGVDPVSDLHLQVIVSRIRRKAADVGIRIQIRNHWGVGYSLDVQSYAVIATALEHRRQGVRDAA